MQGLSFREYLKLFHQIEVPVFDFETILKHQVTVPQLKTPLVYFKEYLKEGYYPFSIEKDFKIRLNQVVNQTLEIDIPTYAQMHISTGRKLKHLLTIVAQSVPFKPNMSKLADLLQVSRNNISDYLQYIEDAGLINQLRMSSFGIQSLGKVAKNYLENTNLIALLGQENQNIGNIRETFFLNQLRVTQEVSASKNVDFQVERYEFEVGGKNKGLKQIKDLPNGFIVKDNIESGYLNTIPLWHFGLMY
jgi:predicted AAA+ superfamily ATPase